MKTLPLIKTLSMLCTKCRTEVPKNTYFMKKIAITLVLSCATIFAQDVFTDLRDGKTYKTIKIGSQTWMAENLGYEAEKSKCYDNNSANCKKYGRLYDWETASNNACPAGWKLPSKQEWDTLVTVIGGTTKGEKLKAKGDIWKSDLIKKDFEDRIKSVQAKMDSELKTTELIIKTLTTGLPASVVKDIDKKIDKIIADELAGKETTEEYKLKIGLELIEIMSRVPAKKQNAVTKYFQYAIVYRSMLIGWKSEQKNMKTYLQDLKSPKYKLTDDFGFTALPGGSASDKKFAGGGLTSFWWSSATDYPSGDDDNEWEGTLQESAVSPYIWQISGTSNDISGSSEVDDIAFASIRCIKGKTLAEIDAEKKEKAEKALAEECAFTKCVDFSGKKYKMARIGNQTWITQNLDYAGEDGYLGLCYGDEPKKKIRKPKNCQKYGRLYDWDEARKVCPKGWHLPTDKEWQELVDFAGGDEVAGKKLKAKSGWEERKGGCKYVTEEIDKRGKATIIEHDECAADEFGFSALPGGSFPGGIQYNGIGNIGFWWSASEGENSNFFAYGLAMGYYNNNVHRGIYDKSYLFSVRCLRD